MAALIATVASLVSLAIMLFTLREKITAHRRRHEPGAEVAALQDIAAAVRELRGPR